MQPLSLLTSPKSLKPVSAIDKLCFSTSKPTYLSLFANKEYLHLVEEKQ